MTSSRKQEKKDRVINGDNHGKERILLYAGMGFIFLATFLSYLPALRAGFIWDDDSFLTENPLIKAGDGLYRFWLTREPPDYFPLTSTSLWIEWRLFGMHAAGYHFINILLHAISSVLFWLVLRELGIPGAWLAGLIWGIHPVNVESVAWITERKNTLPMLFYYLTILLFLKSEIKRDKKLYMASLFSFVLALLSKTSVAMVPFVLLGCQWWRNRKIDKKDMLRTLPFFIPALALSLVTLWFQYHRAIGSDAVRDDGFLSRLIIASWAVGFYLSKALFPLNLSFVYPRWSVNFMNILSYLPGILIVFVTALFWWKRRSWGRAFLFGFGYFLLNLLPILGFFNIYFMKYSFVADHWQYTALGGIIALVCGLGMHYYHRTGKGMKMVLNAAAFLLTVFLFILTYKQCFIYRDVETLWNNTLLKNPKAGLAYHNLGRMLEGRRDLDGAIRHYKQAMGLMPRDPLIPYNLANALKGKGDLEAAILYYKKAVEMKPDFFHAYNNLGLAYMDKGEQDKGEECFRKALDLDSDFVKAYINLGNVLAGQKKFREATLTYEKALSLDPESADSHGNYANTLSELGQFDKAIMHYQKALEIEPDNPIIKKNMEIALRKKNQSKSE